MNEEKGSLFGGLLTAAIYISCIFPYLLFTPSDSDLWWHLRIGVDLVSSGILAETDPYSFAKTVNPWVNHQWLAHALLGTLYQSGGTLALTLFRAGMFISCTGLIYWFCVRVSKSPYLSLLPIILFVFPILNFYFNLRPRIFTFTFLVLILLIIEIAREKKSWMIWLLPIVMLVFANVHGGFMLGLAIALFSLASLFFDGDGTGRVVASGERRDIGIVASMPFGKKK